MKQTPNKPIIKKAIMEISLYDFIYYYRHTIFSIIYWCFSILGTYKLIELFKHEQIIIESINYSITYIKICKLCNWCNAISILLLIFVDICFYIKRSKNIEALENIKIIIFLSNTYIKGILFFIELLNDIDINSN